LSEAPTPKKFTGETAAFGDVPRGKLVSELFEANKHNIARKTEVGNAFSHATIKLLAFHMSDMKNKHDMVPEGTILHKTPNAGDYLRAFIWFRDNYAFSTHRASRLEYLAGLIGVQEQEIDSLKKQRVTETIIGV
jgi:hypothetical protein